MKFFLTSLFGEQKINKTNFDFFLSHRAFSKYVVLLGFFFLIFLSSPFSVAHTHRATLCFVATLATHHARCFPSKGVVVRGERASATMPKQLIGRDATTSLGISLNTDAKSLNNTVKLLTVLRPGHDHASTRSAIIALERFFSERLCRGDLRAPAAAGVGGGGGGGGGGGAGKDAAAAVKYQEWFQKHYKLFTKRLNALLSGVGFGGGGNAKAAAAVGGGGSARGRGSGGGGGVAPKTQVLALAAVMECARSENPGRFNNELYAAALTAALRGNAFTPELLGALSSRYLVKMDVRFHTYATILKIANEIRSGGGGGGGGGEEDGADEDGDGVGGNNNNRKISAADLARNLYDVLSKTPPVFDNYKPPAGGGIYGGLSGGGGGGGGGGGDDDGDDGMDFEAMLGLMKGGGGGGSEGV